MEVINESLKNVVQAKELIKSYMETNFENDACLLTAVDLLMKAEDALAMAT